MKTDSFKLRHIGPSEKDLGSMLNTIKAESIEQLIYETIPDDILLKKPLNLDFALSEQEYSDHMQKLSAKN